MKPIQRRSVSITRRSKVDMPELKREPVYGPEVLITKGTHKNVDQAFINRAEGENGFTEHEVYLVVWKNKQLKGIRIKKSSIAVKMNPDKAPTSYDEAVIDQHRDILAKFHLLAKYLVLHDIDDVVVYMDAFHEILVQEKVEYEKNNKYKTIWNDDDEIDDDMNFK